MGFKRKKLKAEYISFKILGVSPDGVMPDSDVGTTPAEWIEAIKKIEAAAKVAGCKNVTIECDTTYPGQVDWVVHGDRMETDDEFEIRKNRRKREIADEKERKVNVEAEQRKTYEQLKKKFGDE